MIPSWFNKNCLPFDKMLPDDVLWFGKVFDGEFVKGSITYDNDMNRIDYSFKQSEIEKVL